MAIVNKDLIQSYIMTTAKYDFNVYEKRIIYRLVEMAQGELQGIKFADNCQKIEHDLFSCVNITMPIACLLNGEDDKNYARVKEALQSLQRKIFEYEDDEIWQSISIIALPYIRKRSSVLSFQVHPRVWDCILDFSKGFRKYELKAAMSFKSQFSMRFYELLSNQKTPLIYSTTLVTRLLNDSRLKNFHFDSVKKIVYGGSPMNYTTVVRAMEHFHCQLEQAYGATESCCMSVLLPEDHRDCAKGILDKKVLNSAGRPLPMVKVRIITEKGYETNGQACGEIEIKSPFLCSESMSVPGTRTEDGYYPTGDIGYMDEKGFLYLVGRKHDMIISGGENIYPKEVEDCIASLKQDVKQVCVLGMPDPVWGEQVTACIVLKEGSKLTEDDIVAWCKKHIASYKKPRKVIFFSQLPENANGKVSRILLKDQIQKGEIRS